jgi:hypothetical protein
MRLSSMIFVLALSPLSLSAQASNGNTAAVFVKPPDTQACPVQLSIDRKPDGAIVKTKGSAAPHGQGLDIAFWKYGASIQQVKAADITVHFYSAAAHAMPAAPSAARAAAPAPETFHLSAGSGTPIVRTSIWTKHPGIVSWVELSHVEFADGTSWQSSAPRECGAAPNLYVPVEAAATR